MMMRPLACALTLQVATSQQLVIPGVTDGGGCDLSTLPERVQQVDDLCWFSIAWCCCKAARNVAASASRS